MTWDAQEMPVTAIWLQPETAEIDACVIMEMVAGPKRYARFFPHAVPARIEWGWVLGETAVQIWPGPSRLLAQLCDTVESEGYKLTEVAQARALLALSPEERARRIQIAGEPT